jgi:hypothetical protein
VTARWSFIGHPLRSDLPAAWPEGIPIREEPDGVHVYRDRTEEKVPVPRCVCTGLKSQHGTDRRGRPTCFHSAMCGCAQYREKDSE